MENRIEDRVKNIMSAVFEISVNDINNNSSINTIEVWDSLKHMNLIFSLEEEFDIEFEMDEIALLIDYKSICNLVDKKLTSLD